MLVLILYSFSLSTREFSKKKNIKKKITLGSRIYDLMDKKNDYFHHSNFQVSVYSSRETSIYIYMAFIHVINAL